MKKFLLICVNYKSDEALRLFLESVHRAAECVKDLIQVDVKVADNSKDNVGYLGGARRELLQIDTKILDTYDYLAISNVDLEMDESFFKNLLDVPTQSVGWIAPSILSRLEQKDRNPKILHRQSKRHMQIAKLIYIHPLIYRMYISLVYNRRKSQTRYDQQFSYAGHGSFMLFTCPSVIRKCISKFTPFLFCEEHFFAEELRAQDLKVIYTPKLVIYDSDHISTSAMPSKQYCRYNREAIQFIIKNYLS